MTDDIEMLKIEAQAHFDFNQKLLDRSKSSTSEDLQKKLQLIMISKLAHERTTRALQLLSEYLDSTEFMSDAEISETRQLIIDTVNEMLRRNGE